MPLSLKSKGGRLQAFVRGESAARANTTEPARHGSQESEKGPEAPRVGATGPTREEIVEAARVQVPKSSRNTALNHQEGTVSPVRAASPQKNLMALGDVHDDLFAGSQLGEDFMYSGISTSQNESEEFVPNASPKVDVAQWASRKSMDKGPRMKQEAAFFVTEDGFMKVTTGGPRPNPAHMKDGFLNGETSGNTKQSSHYRDEPRHAERLTHLPMREVKIRRSHGHRNGDQGRDESEPSSPEVGDMPWQRHSTQSNGRRNGHAELDEGLDSFDEQDDVHSTPKAQRKTAMPQLALESPLPAASAHRQQKNKKRRRASLDHDDTALSNMTYADLQEEEFDMDPAKAAPQTHGVADGEDLSVVLEHFRHQPTKEQRSMFSNIPISDWESSGDWFVEQFASLMLRMRDARQGKRRMVRDFEDEAAQQEEAVRLRSEAIDRKLLKMKQDGQRVVGDGC